MLWGGCGRTHSVTGGSRKPRAVRVLGLGLETLPPRVDQYEEGTLLLDFVSPRDRQLIWRGSAQSRLRDIKTPEKREARVREVVGKILERFPPGK